LSGYPHKSGSSPGRRVQMDSPVAHDGHHDGGATEINSLLKALYLERMQRRAKCAQTVRTRTFGGSSPLLFFSLIPFLSSPHATENLPLPSQHWRSDQGNPRCVLPSPSPPPSIRNLSFAHGATPAQDWEWAPMCGREASTWATTSSRPLLQRPCTRLPSLYPSSLPSPVLVE